MIPWYGLGTDTQEGIGVLEGQLDQVACGFDGGVLAEDVGVARGRTARARRVFPVPGRPARMIPWPMSLALEIPMPAFAQPQDQANGFATLCLGVVFAKSALARVVAAP